MGSCEKLILSGQLLLTACCGFYIPWWFRVFRPGGVQNWTGGRAGILLLFTALCGLGGLILTISGNNQAQVTRALYPGILVMAAGLAAYAFLMAFTGLVFHRPVTTELVLIVGWTVLELVTLNILYGTGRFRRREVLALIILVLAAFGINMILYVLYYRMDEWKAYYAAAVPLALDGIVMLVIAACIAASAPEGKEISMKMNVASENLHHGVWDTRITKTAYGENVSPQLSFDPVPGAQAYAVYMIDPDGRNWLHWKMLTASTDLAEGEGGSAYVGPYPPSGTHHYHVYVYALDSAPGSLPGELDAPGRDASAVAGQLEKSCGILAEGELTGTYTHGAR